VNRAAGKNEYAPLGITMGCPAGVGPEITVRALTRSPRPGGGLPFVVIGDMAILKRACRTTGLDHMQERIRTWSPGMEPTPNMINVMPVTELSPEQVPHGKVSETTGRAAYAYIREAITLCMGHKLSGMVTAPINKEGLKLAGIEFPGHTEILARQTGTENYAMMLAGPRLRVTLVTIHCALKDVAPALTTEKVFELINTTHQALTNLFRIERPSVAVAGLNPHAGEGGMFGDEEILIIAPAVEQARDAGMDVSGPWPPDTVFHAAWHGRYDAVVCMYHDQGLIPFKLVHFDDGVNITLGLPIIRTSVDHGTAYDIAGTGRASDTSMAAAMDMAGMFARNRLSSR